MEDYVGQRNLLITTFGLEAAMHTQLVSFNATFVVSIFFCGLGVGFCCLKGLLMKGVELCEFHPRPRRRRDASSFHHDDHVEYYWTI